MIGVGIEARWKANGTPHSNVGSNPTSARESVRHHKLNMHNRVMTHHRMGL